MLKVACLFFAFCLLYQVHSECPCGKHCSPELQDKRCNSKGIPFKEDPGAKNPYFNHISQVLPSQIRFVDENSTRFEIPGRPLLGVLRLSEGPYIEKDEVTAYECNKDKLVEQLQTALQLEWSTIPVYLTAYYSIRDPNSSSIAYITNSTLKILEDEMRHMTLAGNMLIALNVSPKINDPGAFPSYPTCGLVGGVLPGLNVELKKMTLEQVHNVFMGIEVPRKTSVAGDIDSGNLLTIGAFYDEIRQCLDYLEHKGEDIFNKSTVDSQVTVSNWPTLPIVDYDSARRAIDVIVSQGEGADLPDPYDVDNDSLAHFFRYEEMVCGQQLVMVDNKHYAYQGPEISLDLNDIKPIHDNFNSSMLSPSSPCYEAAKTFHSTYRKFMEQLDEAFNGNPDMIFVTIFSMTYMTSNAATLTDIAYDSDTNCGLIWDYEWQGG